MNEAQKEIKAALDMLSSLSVSGDVVDLMAAVKVHLREAYRLAGPEKEETAEQEEEEEQGEEEEEEEAEEEEEEAEEEEEEDTSCVVSAAESCRVAESRASA